MPNFLTVKEAAERTGKSSSSIRRVIYPITKDDEHPDRAHVQPSPAEVKELRSKGINFAWSLSEELLKRAIPGEPVTDKEGSQSSPREGRDAATKLLSMLQSELEIKNQQIKEQSAMLSQQMEVINSLSERLREENMLIGSMQQQLALPDFGTRTKSSVVDAHSGNAKSTSNTSKSTPKLPKEPKPKPGLFRRILFR